jgi:hypothetical protein
MAGVQHSGSNVGDRPRVLPAALPSDWRAITSAKVKHTTNLAHHIVVILTCRLLLFVNQGLLFLLGMILMEIATPFINILSIMRWYQTNHHVVTVWGIILVVAFVVVRPVNQIAQVVWLVIIFTNRPGYVPSSWVDAWGLVMLFFLFLNIGWTYCQNPENKRVLVDFAMKYLDSTPNALGLDHPHSARMMGGAPAVNDQYSTVPQVNPKVMRIENRIELRGQHRNTTRQDASQGTQETSQLYPVQTARDTNGPVSDSFTTTHRPAELSFTTHGTVAMSTAYHD